MLLPPKTVVALILGPVDLSVFILNAVPVTWRIKEIQYMHNQLILQLGNHDHTSSAISEDGLTLEMMMILKITLGKINKDLYSILPKLKEGTVFLIY